MSHGGPSPRSLCSQTGMESPQKPGVRHTALTSHHLWKMRRERPYCGHTVLVRVPVYICRINNDIWHILLMLNRHLWIQEYQECCRRMCYPLVGTPGLSEGFRVTLVMFWVANDLENVSASVLLSSGLALGKDVVVDEVVETKFRQGPNIDFGLVLLY